MIISLFPENHHVKIGLDNRTAAIVERILDYVEGKGQAQIDALAKRLRDSRGRLLEQLAAHPDPNTTD